jgi:hypothetical protein
LEGFGSVSPSPIRSDTEPKLATQLIAVTVFYLGTYLDLASILGPLEAILRVFEEATCLNILLPMCKRSHGFVCASAHKEGVQAL